MQFIMISFGLILLIVLGSSIGELGTDIWSNIERSFGTKMAGLFLMVLGATIVVSGLIAFLVFTVSALQGAL